MNNNSKIRVIISILGLTLGLIIGYVVGQHNQYNHDAVELNIYDNYYRATESFLDTLNEEYDWIDAFDNDDYMDAKYKIDSLQNNIK